MTVVSSSGLVVHQIYERITTWTNGGEEVGCEKCQPGDQQGRRELSLNINIPVLCQVCSYTARYRVG